MEPLFFAFVVFAIIGGLISAARAQRAKLNESWARVAHQLGLSLRPADWNRSALLDGAIAGLPVAVDIHKRGSGKSNSIFTRFHLGVPLLPLGLELSREGFLSGISRALGGGDIETGDPAFDDLIRVKGRDAAAIRAFLTPARRQLIRQFIESHPGATISAKGISWLSRGRMTDQSRLMGTIRQMSELARLLADEEPSAEAVTDAAEARRMAEALMSGLPGSEPESESNRASASEPDATFEASTERARDMTDPVADAAPESAPAGASECDVAEFASSVFAPGALSFQASKTFAEHYAGKHVVWQGKLLAAEPYTFDFVFGSGGGVKATLSIHRVETTSFGDGDVKAVVRLPVGTSGLDARIGETVRFRGSLLKVDGLAKKVFVQDGRLAADDA